MRRIVARWWPLAAWAALIAISSSTFVSTKDFVRWMSTNSPWTITEEEFGEFWSDWWWLFVKGYHVLEFTVLFLLLLVTLRRTKLQQGAVLLASYSVTFAYAALDEVHQSFVPLRGGRLTDFLIDMAGATLIAAVLVGRNAQTARAAVHNGATR